MPDKLFDFLFVLWPNHLPMLLVNFFVLAHKRQKNTRFPDKDHVRLAQSCSKVNSKQEQSEIKILSLLKTSSFFKIVEPQRKRYALVLQFSFSKEKGTQKNLPAKNQLQVWHDWSTQKCHHGHDL